MTIAQSFIKFLETQGCGVFGQDLYLSRVPDSKNANKKLFWVIPSGGSVIQTNKTNEKIKSYQFLIYFRSTSAQEVDETLFKLEETFNCLSCVKLEEYEVVSVDANQFASAPDLDSENRMVGFLQVQIQVYKSC